MRPQRSWEDVVRVLNHKGQRSIVEKLRRAVHRLVRERMAAADLIKRSPRRPPEDRLMTLVAGIGIAEPELTLRDRGAIRKDAGADAARRPAMGPLLRKIVAGSSAPPRTGGA